MGLTSYSRFCGVRGKASARGGSGSGALRLVAEELTAQIIADFRRSEDAGVLRLDDEHALIHTVDFFPPIVDDPYTFGRIAAANALSDVYAMGGAPSTAVCLVGFPVDNLEMAIPREDDGRRAFRPG